MAASRRTATGGSTLGPADEQRRGAPPLDPSPATAADPWPPWELYATYGDAREATEAALRDWCSAPYAVKRDAYVVYRAAADREDAAADAWLQSCIALDADARAAGWRDRAGGPPTALAPTGGD